MQPKNYYFVYIFLLFLSLTNLCWSQNDIPPTLSATGDQFYCPLSQLKIVTEFDISDPDDTEINALYIQISTGYIQGEDILILTGSHPNIIASWNISEGKLTLTGPLSGTATYSDMIAAVKDIIFESSSPSPSGDKFFSFTIGNANYLPSTGHYYEFISDIGITWTSAETVAEARTYYGLQGYLATITSQEEAQLSGEQASGAGWIGGSDAETEEVWKWVTGPENGTIFWNGGINGSTPNFAYWNTNEPNNLNGEDYAHVTAPNVGINGSWNDLSNTGAASGDFQPKGYIVEYGGMPGDSTLNISSSTSISIASISTVSESKRCGAGSISLSAEANDGTVFWFDSATSDTPISSGTNFTTPEILNTTTYFALASVDGCMTGNKTPVIATVDPAPIVMPSIIFKNCDEDGVPDGFTDFNLNEANNLISFDNNDVNVTYHLSFSDADSGSNIIDPLPFNNATANTIYARVENTYGCYRVSTVNLQVSNTAFPSGYIFNLQSCDDDDDNINRLRSFDLSEASADIIAQFPIGQDLSVHYYRNVTDAELEQNEILPQSSFENEIPFSQTLYVRVENDDNGDCFGIGPRLTLTVHPRPVFEVSSATFVCLNLPPITLEVFNAEDNYTYEWTDENDSVISNGPTALISSGGTFNVIATSSFGCESYPRSIVVSASNIANIGLGDITIIDDLENNSIAINNQQNNLGIGSYEFALNDVYGPYQDEALFENVHPGTHVIYVRDKNNCGTSQILVAVLGFPKFFTPNNDGSNDRWGIIGINEQFVQASPIYIYDRFGKNVAKIDPDGEGWDGLYNGHVLPESDYWFKVQLKDEKGTLYEKRGHFSLIKR